MSKYCLASARDLFFEEVWAKAKATGVVAGEEAIPVPMIVGQAKSLVSDEIDHSKPTHYVSEGACGFAWVNVKPGTSQFARWLKVAGHARSDSYYGGVTIWVGEHGQSVTRKEAHAKALAEVLRRELDGSGVRVHWNSRLD